jgi:predicted DNA-binding antitoxin AbrB/MazE fold protein
MATIEAIYEHGVFRPLRPVTLPENSRVHLQIVNGSPAEAAEQNDDMEAIYPILDRRHTTGISDLAARHNEHQP